MSLTDAQIAESLYVNGLSSGFAQSDWEEALTLARRRVFRALRSSYYLTRIEDALAESGEHLLVFRHMFGPPLSQDQFALICSAYRKAWEKTGRAVSHADAMQVAEAVRSLVDPKIAKWLSASRRPSTREIRLLIASVAPMLSLQTVATVRRNRLSLEQEGAATALLEAMGWARVSSGLVQQASELGPGQFMHKTRFATQTRPQEVDIACGLGTSVVLAMECKVTNDHTNSVKRVNDILKKATAWQLHWGSFVRTAALLQGVIADKDVARLTAANVQVFWSHDLCKFQSWLEENAKLS